MEATIELRLADGDIARDPAKAKRSCDMVVEEALRRRLSVTVFKENGSRDVVIQVSGQAAGRFLPDGFTAGPSRAVPGPTSALRLRSLPDPSLRTTAEAAD